jgi:outer membrane receptor protein involved in Fe transport
VPSFWLANLSAGYKLKSLGGERPTLQVNVTNLFDKQYLSSIGTNGFTATDAINTLQSMLTGAPRQVFVAERQAVMRRAVAGCGALNFGRRSGHHADRA